ncbi:MAG TPA: cytidine deaminase [Tepidisphaeraceae bacterium]|nr:cytidine deaminase [Tepidisphaeraceae bacterium]
MRRARAIDQALVDAAKSLAATRWPLGEAGAAAMYTASGRLLTSVCVDGLSDAVLLCHETGAICEAHKFDDPVTASVCVARDDERSPFVVLPPCGVCCERLAFWGGDVEVAVPAPGGGWEARLLRELLPHFWRGRWPGDA